jgi:hypothetical protein
MEKNLANNDGANDETNDQSTSEEDQTPGMKAAMINSDPTISLEEARRATAGEESNGAGSTAPSTAEDYVPSNSDPNPSNLPSTDHPMPDDVDNLDEEPISASSESEEADRYAH